MFKMFNVKFMKSIDNFDKTITLFIAIFSIFALLIALGGKHMLTLEAVINQKNLEIEHLLNKQEELIFSNGELKSILDEYMQVKKE